MALKAIDIVATGKRLKSLCESKNLKAAELHKRLHLSCPQSVYRWFNGEALPTIDNLYILSDILGVDIEDMIVPISPALFKDNRWLIDLIEEEFSNSAYLRRRYSYKRTADGVELIGIPCADGKRGVWKISYERR